MMDEPWWEKKYSKQISSDKPLDVSKSRGYAIIYAPDIAQSLSLDKHTLFYFTWSSSNAILRVYDSESTPPKPLGTSKHGYKPAEVAEKIVRGITLPNSHREQLTNVSCWYNYIQNKKKQWFPEESADETEPLDTVGKENEATDDNVADAHFIPKHSPSKLSVIQSYLMEHKGEVCEYFYTTNEQWTDLIQHRKRPQAEKVLTFLIGCSYALSGEQGVETLTKILTGLALNQPAHPMIWFEAQPMPPRVNEGNTHLDLALGAIAKREGTASGIRFDDSAPSWICFCEAKFDSDISPGVEYDSNRNQLARVIENAICFQNSGKYPNDVYMTVITPKAFSHKRSLLEEKFSAYKSNPKSLLYDLNQCSLTKRGKTDWFYPYNVAERITKNLKLRWVYFEDLVENLPDSDISEHVKDLWNVIMQ